jgi:hypothetical protein
VCLQSGKPHVKQKRQAICLSYCTTRKRSENNSSRQQNQIRQKEGMLHNVNAVIATTAANVADQQVIDVIGVSAEERPVKLQ